MPVQGSMQSLTAVAASNSPAGTDAISNTLDDYLRSFAGILRHTQAQAATLTASASMSLAAATGQYVPVDCAASLSSAVSIAHLGTVDAGIRRTLLFDGYAKLIHGANLLLPGSATIVTTTGDTIEAISDGSGAWRVIGHSRQTGDRTSTNGSIALPGGLIVKFGFVTSSGTAAKNATATFTTAFPNAALRGVAVVNGTGVVLANLTVQVEAPSTTALSMTALNNGSIANGLGVHWLCLGY